MIQSHAAEKEGGCSKANVTNHNPFHWLTRRLWGYDFFISYNWCSAGKFSEDLRAFLAGQGYDVFLDRQELAGGDELKVELFEAIRHTQLFLLVATKEAVSSNWVKDEFEQAGKYKIPMTLIHFARDPIDQLRAESTIQSIPRDKLWLPVVQADPQAVDKEQIKAIASEIIKSCKILRRRTLRLRILITCLCAIFLSATLAALFWQNSKFQEKIAQTEIVTSHFRFAESEIAHERSEIALIAYWKAYEVARRNADDRELSARHQLSTWSATLDQLNVFRSQGPCYQPGCEIVAMSSSPDGKTLFLVDAHDRPQLIDAETMERRHTLNDAPLNVQTAGYSADGALVAVAGGDLATAWDAQSGTKKFTVQHPCPINTMAFSDSGSSLATGGGHDVCLWATSGEKICDAFHHEDKLYLVALDESGCLLAVAQDKSVRVWDTRFQKVACCIPFEFPIEFLIFANPSKLLVVGNGQLWSWNPRSGKSFGSPTNIPGKLLSISQDRRTALIQSHGYQLWDIPIGQLRGGSIVDDDRSINDDGALFGSLSSNAERVFIATRKRGVTCWHALPPALNEPSRLKLSLEVRTHFELDVNGTRKSITDQQWSAKQKQLMDIGGPCDVISLDHPRLQ